MVRRGLAQEERGPHFGAARKGGGEKVKWVRDGYSEVFNLLWGLGFTRSQHFERVNLRMMTDLNILFGGGLTCHFSGLRMFTGGTPKP